METWLLILVSIAISFLLKFIFNNFLGAKKLPPGPLIFPIISNFLWFSTSMFKGESILRSLHAKFGPIVTLNIGARPVISMADRNLCHQALIRNGALYADRPEALPVDKIISNNQLAIVYSRYGPAWRLLRRNLTAEILNPSGVKSYSRAREWVLQILQNRLESQAKSGRPVFVMEHFRYAMFCLLVLMCFGDKLDENQIKKIEEVEHQLLVNLHKFSILNFCPRVTKIVLRKRWEELFRLLKCQEDDESVLSYVDTLLDLQLPDENRKLNELEIVSLCSEFLSGGTDTTTTALQWIMANLVKYPQIQEKLFMEIKGVVGEEKIQEDDLQRIPYLKAVVLEGLRRHPPSHFMPPHAVTEDVVVGEYVIPKEAAIIINAAEMGWDPKVWEDPMSFNPSRFLNKEGETFDMTGRREIKMMPFGVGRRICPGYALSMLHLEYFVVNLVSKFEWKSCGWR
ncbi:P450 putative-RELATED [Salix purpurea]|uniref:P450 putative-RELATED n=1 Tax=Salix purpurea TaxID=77065 RepID=A0A9Q0ZI26_SALPP|nr:P450 putative-RELATED [Salix purpurea]